LNGVPRRQRRCAHGFLAARQAGLHRFQQFLHGNRLFQEIQCADARCLHRRVDRGVARHHDDRHRQQAVTLPLLEQRHAVRVRHPDIKQDQIRRALRARLARLLRVFGKLYRVSLVAQYFREQLADTHFIIHYQNVCHLSLPFFISPDMPHCMRHG
jgi:hypothetical protein